MFRTELNISPYNFTISHNSTIVSIGSCFADMIGKQFEKYKFDVLSNPFGNIYNPLSLHRLFKNHEFLTNSYIERDGCYFSPHLHSEIFAHSQEELSEIIRTKKQTFDLKIKNADTLILTYGTAWVYQTKANSEIVANCHKLPQHLFEKNLLSVDEMVDDFKKLALSIKDFNKKRIIVTVSPVRHIKDTLSLNNVSKSSLRLFVHQIENAFENVHYFPAFELVNDDLRDYRFFKSDMIHPNEQAEEYIWKKFTQAVFDANTHNFVKNWDEILSAKAHKPFNPTSETHQKFIKSQIAKLESLSSQTNVSEEIGFFKKQLI